ncbi:hypothetical protein SADUNF_Sadunf13G0052300 [Salix dunnii]|uniref:Cupin type-1 domain-containing protein n=1 Tax=Salix dunnii TaxID=1413687 RepID=A0A835MKU6_9ROSI|nr:hypothetical protein SADUNF_Sadunf13G0052300 [Salix dunnii]
MEGLKFLLAFVLLALASSFASASDPSPLQDFCVAINETDGVFVNGKFCKDPAQVTEKDFFFPGLNTPGDTSGPVGSNVTTVNVAQIAGLNTLGISFARIDYAPYGGLNPPHTHPRASEILVVVEGTLYVGFVTSNLANGDNRLITKVLNPGDVFVFPIGLIHFQFNVGKTNAVAFASLSSQNPGVITIGNAVFGADPSIKPDVLAKAFQVDKKIQIHPLSLMFSPRPSKWTRRLKFVLVFVLLALASSFASASDPSPLQDFCVAINETDGVFVNGKFCKDPAQVTEKDFFFPGLNTPGDTSGPVGSNVTTVNDSTLLNPPHTHPRASEILVVVEGTLYVGFVTSNLANGDNRLITKVLNPGDVFVFPIGLIHFQFNVGKTNAVAFASLSSQNPGVITIGNAVFGADPPIKPDVLAKAFQVDKKIVDYLQKQFWTDNN